jgi:hypothetical protein
LDHPVLLSQDDQLIPHAKRIRRPDNTFKLFMRRPLLGPQAVWQTQYGHPLTEATGRKNPWLVEGNRYPPDMERRQSFPRQLQRAIHVKGTDLLVRQDDRPMALFAPSTLGAARAFTGRSRVEEFL